MLIYFLCLACLAAANGANDVSRAAATLVGGKVTAYKRAMLWTVGWTLLGSALSGWLAAGVARRFGAAVAGNAHELDMAIPAVLLGSCAWVAVATYRKLPVATTHSLVGSLLGVTWAAGGWAACHRIDLARGFMVPLIASPFIAMTFSIALRKLLPAVAIRTPKALDRGHWVSAGLTALSRGINDSAKIWAILLPLAVVFHGQVAQFTHLTQATVALAMLSGSLVAGHRVTERLAFGVAPMSCVDSVVANAVTATTIIAASLLSFPVASSHVVSGAILGTGLASNRNGLKWRSILEMASAWVLTLPAAAILSTTMFFGLRRAKAAGVAPATAILGVLLVAAIVAAAIQLMRESGRTRTTVGATSASLPARLVVFVCNSNTSRSPMAAELCKALLARTELRIAADGGWGYLSLEPRHNRIGWRDDGTPCGERSAPPEGHARRSCRSQSQSGDHGAGKRNPVHDRKAGLRGAERISFLWIEDLSAG